MSDSSDYIDTETEFWKREERRRQHDVIKYNH